MLPLQFFMVTDIENETEQKFKNSKNVRQNETFKTQTAVKRQQQQPQLLTL